MPSNKPGSPPPPAPFSTVRSRYLSAPPDPPATAAFPAFGWAPLSFPSIGARWLLNEFLESPGTEPSHHDFAPALRSRFRRTPSSHTKKTRLAPREASDHGLLLNRFVSCECDSTSGQNQGLSIREVAGLQLVTPTHSLLPQWLNHGIRGAPSDSARYCFLRADSSCFGEVRNSPLREKFSAQSASSSFAFPGA